MAGEDLKTQLAGLLGLGSPAPSGGASPPTSPATPPPATSPPAGTPPAAAAPGAAIDYDKLAAAIVRQGGAPGGTAGQPPPAAPAAPPAAPSMVELLMGMRGQAGGPPGTPPPPAVAMPRVVRRLEQESGYVDVFALSDAEVAAMPIEQLVGHFERARDAARAQSGAPLLPRAMRNAQRR